MNEKSKFDRLHGNFVKYLAMEVIDTSITNNAETLNRPGNCPFLFT